MSDPGQAGAAAPSATAGAEMTENLEKDLASAEKGAEKAKAPPAAPLPPEATDAARPPEKRPAPVVRMAFPEGKPPIKLFAAMARLQEKAIEAPHDATNERLKRDYTSSEGIIAAWKMVVVGTGLAIVGLPPRVSGPRSENGPSWMVRDLYLTHESGEYLDLRVEWPLLTHAGKTIEDALKGGMTQSMAWLMRDWALIPKKDGEPEEAPRGPAAARAGPAKEAPPAKQSAPAAGTFAHPSLIGAMKEAAKKAGLTMVADLKGFIRDALAYEVAAVEQVTEAEAKKVIAALQALPPKAAPPAAGAQAAKP